MSYEIPHNFLGLDTVHSNYDQSMVLILPVPYEATVSYGGGTAAGPEAIIAASQQVELYDREFEDEPGLRWGVHTLPALTMEDASPDEAMGIIAAEVQRQAGQGKLLCVLGGEHSISGAVAQGLFAAHGPFVTVQIDAHADLRDEYEGTPHSHACAMRRVLDAGAGPVLQLGIRSLSVDEAEVIRSDERVTTFFSEDIHAGMHLAALADFVRGQPVYLTIDIDGLDVSLVPATGTPEPDGLSWNETLEIVRIVAREAAQVLAFDVMELAPIAGFHSADFVTAKLTYKTMSIIMAAQAAE
ncbi:MAG: agmatinase [Herpetosiphonaceae bacterium]|nr:agmatinase [Herpetosiphonaceae bacterium]